MIARTPPPKATNASETARQMSQVFVDVVFVSRFPMRSSNLSITWSHVVRPMAYTTKWGHSVSQVRWSTCLCLNLCNFPYQRHLCSRTPTNNARPSPILIVIIYLISLTLSYHSPSACHQRDFRSTSKLPPPLLASAKLVYPPTTTKINKAAGHLMVAQFPPYGLSKIVLC